MGIQNSSYGCVGGFLGAVMVSISSDDSDDVVLFSYIDMRVMKEEASFLEIRASSNRESLINHRK
jgi:hypothetical protein